MSRSAEGIFLRMTKWSIFALAFVGIVFYPNILFPDVFAKGTFVRLAIELSFAGFLWLLALGKVSLPRMTPFAWAATAFLSFALLSMLASPSIYRSFWGEAQRMEGVFGLLHYGALFLVARATFKKEDWLRYFKLVLLTVPFLVFYLLLQEIRVRTGTHIPFVVGAIGNPGSLFGNPAFFSMFLIFAAGFAVFVHAMEEGRAWKIFSRFVVAVSILSIVWMGIRGEVLGALAGAIVFFGLSAFWIGNTKFKRYFVAAVAAFAVLIAALFALRPQAYEYYPRLLQRIVNLPSEPSFLTRAYSVGSSLKAFADSPKTILIGWGQEHFITGYNKYYDPRHGSFEDVWFDRAHVKPMDVLVMGGIAGSLAYASLFGALLWYIRRLRKDSAYAVVAVGAGALLTAYFAQNLAIFDMPHTYVNFFLLGAFLDSRAYPRPPEEARSGKGHPFGFAAAASATIGIAALMAYTIVIPIRQSRLYLELLRPRGGQDIAARWEEIFRPRNFAHYTLIDDIWRRLQAESAYRKPEFQPLTDRVIGELTYIVEREPMDAPMKLRLASVYTERAVGFERAEDYAAGERYVREAIALAPDRQENYYLLAFNLQGQGRHEEAVKIMEETVALNPGTNKAQYLLGLNLALAGRNEEAVAQIEKVRAKGWFSNPVFQENDVDNVIKIYTLAGKSDLREEFLKWSLGNGHTKRAGHFVLVLQLSIRKEDSGETERWANEYARAYPEFRNEMDTVIRLAEAHEWAELKRLTGTAP